MKERWRARQELVERALQAELDRTDVLDDTLRQAMAYSLMAGGKRLRPVLLMAAADAVGADGAKFLSVACALEMIHTYSLIHDDLPAMDNDDYRRGKLTNHKVFGDGIAILAGDGLLTLAFTVILRQQDVSADTLLRVVVEITRAAGAEGMVGGQVLDLRAEEHRAAQRRNPRWGVRGTACGTYDVRGTVRACLSDHGRHSRCRRDGRGHRQARRKR